MSSIRIKRIYDAPSRVDGRRVLVDRLWPRGVTKEKARIDHWAKSVAPSHELRRWYGHDPDRWEEFQRRYHAELDENPDEVEALRKEIAEGTVTFVFQSKEEKLNNAHALRDYLEGVEP